MHLIVTSVAVAIAVLASPVDASTLKFRYSYTGLPLELAENPNNLPNVRDRLAGYRLALVVKEPALPGGTLRNARLRFCTDRFSEPGCQIRFPGFTGNQGLLSVDSLSDEPFFVWDSTGPISFIELLTDEDRKVVFWNLGVDYSFQERIGIDGDSLADFEPDETSSGPPETVWRSSGPGTWEVAPIPLPATLPMMAIVCLALLAARRRITT